MSATRHQELIPQLEEDITAMKWMSPSDQGWQANTFASIKDVIEAPMYGG